MCATTAEKLRGPRFGSQHRGGAGLGVGCGRGSPLPAVRVRKYHPRKMFENSDAKSCILVTTCCEISCFLKTTAKKWGGETNTIPILVPNLGDQSPPPVPTVVAPMLTGLLSLCYVSE